MRSKEPLQRLILHMKLYLTWQVLFHVPHFSFLLTLQWNCDIVDRSIYTFFHFILESHSEVPHECWEESIFTEEKVNLESKIKGQNGDWRI